MSSIGLQNPISGSYGTSLLVASPGSNGGAIAGRSLDDVLPLYWNRLRPLKNLPHLGDA